MSLVRKVRKVGSSLVITLPAHLTDFHGINEGTFMEIINAGDGKILLKKVIE